VTGARVYRWRLLIGLGENPSTLSGTGSMETTAPRYATSASNRDPIATTNTEKLSIVTAPTLVRLSSLRGIRINASAGVLRCHESPVLSGVRIKHRELGCPGTRRVSMLSPMQHPVPGQKGWRHVRLDSSRCPSRSSSGGLSKDYDPPSACLRRSWEYHALTFRGLEAIGCLPLRCVVPG
jgi:hypothetical protein